MQALAQNVHGIRVPDSGHWIPEERPDFVIKMLDNFFDGNTTNTNTSDPIFKNQQVKLQKVQNNQRPRVVG